MWRRAARRRPRPSSHPEAALYDTHPDRLRPILPCYRSAFAALREWVQEGTAPPADRTIARPTGGDVINSCALNAP